MAPSLKGGRRVVVHRFAQYDLCDFVTFTLAGIAFALGLYVVV